MGRRILIAGGGIGGLCSAIGLQNAGFDVTVFEHSAAFTEVGAGITLGLTAMRALDYLGVGATIGQAADVPKLPVVAHYKTGLPVAGAHTGENAPFDPSVSFHQIHRADLHRILSDAVLAKNPGAILFSRDFVDVAQDEDGVTAIFADGAQARGEALIGCDGVRSTLRKRLFDNEKPRFTGQVAWRFLAPADAVKQFLSLGGSAHYMGPDRNFVRYLVRHGTVLNAVAFATTDSWTEEGWSIRSSREELLAQYQGWNDDVLGLIGHAPADGIYKWALFDRDPLKVWTDRRVALLGDAAHPMLPFLGLGAAMAIEDSVLLARSMVQTDDISRALRQYEAARKDRAAMIMLASRKQAKIYNSVDPDDYVKTERPTADFSIYAYDPATQELPKAAP